MNITPYQRDNLETLAAFLEGDEIPPPQFDISLYVNIDYGPEDLTRKPSLYTECGTTACAIGHGPLAGIPALFGESWVAYAWRAFGTYWNFGFLFSERWQHSSINNTAKGTAARIRYYLAHGVPEYNYYGSDITKMPWFDGVDISWYKPVDTPVESD